MRLGPIDQLRVVDVGRFLAAGLAWWCLVEGGGSASAQSAFGEEIVVTAQRREEHPEDVPISLTAVSGEGLEDRQATDMASLGKVVPSLQMTRTGAFTQPYLRGIGKRSTLGAENSVATYVDGVYVASAIGALLDLRGIERVEVLNGPQGTLFGRNATGGVIQVITRDPRPGFSGEAEFHAGTYGYIRGDAYVNGGNDRIAGNVAVSLSRNGGYGTNVFTGKKVQGDLDHGMVARSKWRWWATDDVKLILAGDYQDSDQDFALLPLAGFPPIGEPRVQGFRDFDEDLAQRNHFHYGGLSLQAEAGIGVLKLVSLTAARWLNARYGTDLDGGPTLLLTGIVNAKQDQFSQEFQLQSSETARVKWTAGLYYIGIEERYDPTIFRYGGSYSGMLGGRTLQTLFDVGEVSSYAAYGQATLPIGDATRVTAGLRYTIEKRSVDARGERQFDNPPFVRPIPGLPLPDEAPFKDSKEFREPTWRASIDHDFSSEWMGYVSVSRGFQSGGWNLQTPQLPAFEPETLDDYEAGFKFAGRSGRVRADAAAFIYDYSDLQVSQVLPIGSTTTNAASAKVHGIELQFGIRPDEKTEITAGAQWLKAEFDHFPNASCVNYDVSAAVPYATVPCDATGNRLPYAPKLKANLGASHKLGLGNAGTVLISGNLAYNSGYFSESDNVVRQDAFATLDASAEWSPLRHGPSVKLWALNLTDTHYHDSLVTFPTAGVLQRPAPPRRFGISVAHRF